MKARDQHRVAALRSALAAIDNAEAVDPTSTPPPGQAPTPAAGEGTTPTESAGPGPVEGAIPVAASVPSESAGPGPVEGATPVAGAVLGVGAGEVERRRLTVGEMEAIVRREVAERRAAARAYEDAGQGRYAEGLRAEADLLSSYLGDAGSFGAGSSDAGSSGEPARRGSVEGPNPGEAPNVSE
jgi:uncharacterized protein